MFCNEAVEAVGDGIEESPGGRGRFPRNNYRKLVVEMFRHQAAERPVLLTAP
jgi:hypothetical protein